MKRLILPLMIAGALAGCASFPEGYDKPLTQQDLVQEMRDVWSATPPIVFMQSQAGRVVKKSYGLPAELASKPVKVALEEGASMTLADVARVLHRQGYRVVSQLGSDSAGLEVLTHSFDGTLEALLDELAGVHNIAYEYRNGLVFLTEASRYVASLPKHKALIDQVAASLKEMGALDVRADLHSGQIYYTAKPSISDMASDYVRSVATNSAMVTLQVAVLTVGVNRDVALGFDWAQFAVKSGTRGFSPANNFGVSGAPGAGGAGTGTGTTVGTPGMGSTGTGTGAAAAAVAMGQLVSVVGGDGFGYKFVNDAFSLTAALKALSTYGNARTEQNVVLSTLSGLPVKIESGNEIPYVKSVGSATTSGGATQGSTQTDVVKSGLTVEVVPSFEAEDRSVITEVNVKLATLVGFRELNAGQNLGTLSQPEMQNMTFENVGRIAAGETLLIGGITYDQLTNNYTSFPGMEKSASGSKSEKVNRNAMYIVLRPTVVVFSPDADKLNAAVRAALPQVQAAARDEKGSQQ